MVRDIKQRKPYDDPNHPVQYNVLPEVQKQLVRYWIDCRIEPASRYCNVISSYGLKHSFQFDTGLYVSNGAFKGAMLEAGFRAKDEQEANATYKMRLARRQKSRFMEWAKEHGFHVEYDSEGQAHVIRLEDGSVRPP
jgi:hypothetical protein